MMIYFPCPRCKRHLTIGLKMAGLPIHCPLCRSELIVPSASEPALPRTPKAVLAAVQAAALPGAASPAATGAPGPAGAATLSEPVSTPDAPAVAGTPAPGPGQHREPVTSTPRRRRRVLAGAAATGLMAASVVAALVWINRDHQARGDSEVVAQAGPGQPAAPRAAPARKDAPTPAPAAKVPAPSSPVQPKEKAATPAARQKLDVHLAAGAPALPKVERAAKKPAPLVKKLGNALPDDGTRLKPPVIKRRDRSKEEDLLPQLARVPKVSLTARSLVSFFALYAETMNTRGPQPYMLEPAMLLSIRPDLRMLPMRSGPASRIGPHAAEALHRLGGELRAYLDMTPITKDDNVQKRWAGLLRDALKGQRRGKRPPWLRAEAIPTLMQMLSAEDAPVRRLLVELLAEITGKAASEALAQRAVFDLSAEVRAYAVAALLERPPAEYRRVLIEALRHPWAPAADHAAEALAAVHDLDALPRLVTLLAEPDPLAPFPGSKKGIWYVREMVRINHKENCLMCHPPVITQSDLSPIAAGGYGGSSAAPVDMSRLGGTPQVGRQVPGLWLTVGQVVASPTPPPNTLTVSTSCGKPSFRVTPPRPLYVRADVTYLRQDFAVQQPVMRVAPLELPERFDYVLRTRRLPPEKPGTTTHDVTHTPDYPQRQAVLFALRELTGKDLGPSVEAWRHAYPARDPDLEDEATRWCTAFKKATPGRQQQLLNRMRTSQGAVYTLALAWLIPSVDGPLQEQVRTALADRLTRMTTWTLGQQLHDENAEVRRAAAAAVARTKAKALLPELRALLNDADAAVAQAAEAAVKSLAEEDHANPAAAGKVHAARGAL
jgi:HEAT repeat protein